MSLGGDKTWMAVTSTAKGGAQGRDAAYSPLRERIGMILADAGGAVAAAPRRSAPCTAAANASRLNGFLSTGSAPVCASNIQATAYPPVNSHLSPRRRPPQPPTVSK